MVQVGIETLVAKSFRCRRVAAYNGPNMFAVGVNRDSLVLGYQFGNGLTNLISPTNGLLLAGLAIARIRFSQWFKVICPFFLMAWLLAAILAWVSAYL